MELYKVCIIENDEIVIEGFSSYSDAEDFINASQNPDSLYIGWYEE